MVTERLIGQAFFTLRDNTKAETAVKLNLTLKLKIDITVNVWGGRWIVPTFYNVVNCEHTQNGLMASITQ